MCNGRKISRYLRRKHMGYIMSAQSGVKIDQDSIDDSTSTGILSTPSSGEDCASSSAGVDAIRKRSRSSLEEQTTEDLEIGNSDEESACIESNPFESKEVKSTVYNYLAIYMYV